MAKFGVVVIGAGAIATNAHLPSIMKMPELELKAVADIDLERARHVASSMGSCLFFSDYNDAIRLRDVDAVVICTPNYLHARMAIDALKAGKHVLCEKPMATNMVDARRMQNFARKQRKVLMVGFTHRYTGFYTLIEEVIGQSILGRIFSTRVRFAHEGPYVSWPAVSDWFFDKKKAAGGALLDMGIHALDLVMSLFGKIEHLHAYVGTLIKPIEVEDNATLLFRTDEGIIGTIDVSWTSQSYIGGIEIYGTDGSMLVDYGRDTVFLYVKEKRGKYPKGWNEVDAHWGSPYQNEMRCFVDAITGKNANYPGGKEGSLSLAVALSAYESARKRRTVRIRSD